MKSRFLIAALAAAAFTLSACDDGPTESGSAADVTVGFSAAAFSAQSSAAASISSPIAVADVVLEGENGTLTITDVAFIVDEFKLERLDGSCEAPAGEDDDECETFETGAAFVELPLEGGIVPVVTQPIPSGTYVEMKFEVKDAGGADQSGADLAALLDAIEAAGFTDWPDNASLVVAGTFTPSGGEPEAFTAYFDAEIKIEMALDPALVIDAEDGIIDVEVDPVAWFTNTDGTVVDLRAFDYATTGEVTDFEAKLEYGFTKIEIEGFDD